MPRDDSMLSDLPPGSEIRPVDFVSQRPADQQVLLQFPLPLQRWAVLVKSEPDQQPPDLWILTVPASDQPEAELLGTMRQWVDTRSESRQDFPEPAKDRTLGESGYKEQIAEDRTLGESGYQEPQSHMMTFQGAQIFWSERRIAVLAPTDRLESISKALIEVSYYDAEVRDIERTLGENWPQLEADMPLAFEMNAGSIGKRKQLHQRFQQIQRIRVRLAQIAPHVHCPHIYPPTLASQIGERLRERTRMTYRHEFLDDQVEVFEEIYEMCGQRASDFALARTGHSLEWAIIVLLLAQILLWGFEILTSVGQ